MSLFTVSDACTQCGLCAHLCVMGIVQFEKSSRPFVLEAKEKNCLRCGQCVAYCPTSACHLDFQPEEDRVAVHAAAMPSAESAETLIRSRRSVRKYKENPVDAGTVRRIIESARYAPSASNSQPVRWIVSQTRQKTLELGAFVAEFIRAEDTSSRYSGIVAAWDTGVDVIFRGAPQLAVAVVDQSHLFPEDGAIALTYFELAAHANGVGCCWAGFFTLAARKSPALRQALGAKDHETVVGGQMFGYPTLGPSRLLPPRKKNDITWL